MLKLLIVAIIIFLVLNKLNTNRHSKDNKVRITYLSPNQAGVITKILVNEGDYIKIGDKLFLMQLVDGTEDEIISTIEGTVLDIYLYENTSVKANTPVIKVINSPEDIDSRR